MAEGISSLEDRLLTAMLGSCTCGTKAPTMVHHDPLCHSRLFEEAFDYIDATLKEKEPIKSF